MYRGQWVAGARTDPKAVVHYENGEVYEGGFLNDVRTGPAKWWDAKGNTFVGAYKDNEKDLSSWTCHQIYANGAWVGEGGEQGQGGKGKGHGVVRVGRCCLYGPVNKAVFAPGPSQGAPV